MNDTSVAPWLTLDTFSLFPHPDGVRLTQGDQSVVLSPEDIHELHRVHSEGRPLFPGTPWRFSSPQQQGQVVAALLQWRDLPAGQVPPPPNDLHLRRIAEVIAPAPSILAGLGTAAPVLLVATVLILAVVAHALGLPLRWALFTVEVGLTVSLVWYLLIYRS